MVVRSTFLVLCYVLNAYDTYNRVYTKNVCLNMIHLVSYN